MADPPKWVNIGIVSIWEPARAEAMPLRERVKVAVDAVLFGSKTLVVTRK